MFLSDITRRFSGEATQLTKEARYRLLQQALVTLHVIPIFAACYPGHRR